MSSQTKLVPTASQTVGPYFRIGLESLIHEAPAIYPGGAGSVHIRGRVLDRDRAPVPDALLEFWTPGTEARNAHSDSQGSAFPPGFRRAATDAEGRFTVAIERPEPSRLAGGTEQAPYLLVLLFARGLLRHLVTRVYFENDPANESDSVLLGIHLERRHTLIAKHEGNNEYGWDLVLQGDDETVFFAC